jgi:hypothetical protein
MAWKIEFVIFDYFPKLIVTRKVKRKMSLTLVHTQVTGREGGTMPSQ